MADIRIRVGASLDGSPSVVFKSLGDMARKARAQVATELNRVGEPLGVSVKANAVKAERAMASLRAKVGGGDLMNPATRSIKEFGDEASKRFEATKRRFKELSGEVTKGAKEIERAEKQAARSTALAARREERESAKRDRDSARSSRAFRTDAGRVGLNVARGALNLGTRLIGDVAAGAGVDVDFASMARKNVALETKATALSNAGFMPGTTGANAERQDPADIIKQAREVALATATDTNEAIDGLASFVAKTGDLATGRAIFKDMAVLAKATGTSLDDMVDAAGDVSSALGDDMPNKAAAIQQVMRAVAAGGKLGAVEMRDLASQMAKLAASANLFEGDAADNIRKFAALAQESRAHGGSSSATQAATSVSSFVATFTKGARLKEFDKFGVSTKGASGKTRDFNEIILDAIVAASSEKNGGLAKMNLNMGKMFMDRGARRSTLGFESAYVAAGGGDAGVAAVREEMRKLNGATLGATEELESFKAATRTTAAQAQNFNTQMEAAASQMQDSLKPAMLALAPTFVAAAAAINEAILRITGKREADADHAGDRVFDAGAGDARAIRRAIRTGEALPEGAYGKAVADEAALSAEAGRRKVAAAEAKKKAGFGGALEDIMLAGISPVTAAADWTHRQKAAGETASAAESFQKQYEDLHNAIKKITDKPLEVKVVSQPPPPIVADRSGSQPVAGP
jgi:hypothetical protein